MAANPKLNFLLKSKWRSLTGSTLNLEINGSVITGTFVYSGGGTEPIHGCIEPINVKDENYPLSFSVYWPPTSGYDPAITSYTGQLHIKGGLQDQPFIDVVFLMVIPQDPQNEYKAVNVGHDIFNFVS